MINGNETLAKSQLFTLQGESIEVTVSLDGPALGNTKAGRKMDGMVIDQKYRIICLLGEGGMGAVYKAHHLTLNKEVALKTFRSPNLTDGSWSRFHREALAIARLNNKNVVQVFDFGVGEDNVPYYTMECLSGESLAERLATSGPLPLDQTIKIFLQVCHGLSAAHIKGIVHRDLKPANIFLAAAASGSDSDCLVKIVDFGIAGLATTSMDGQKLTTTGSIFGSPLYMSPEQSLGQTMTERSDIYSCGCAIFESLAGRPPFRGENAFATMLMHQQIPVPRLNDLADGKTFKPGAQWLIDRMMAKDQSERFQSFEDVAAGLEDISMGLNISYSTARQRPSHAHDDAHRSIDDPFDGSAGAAKPVLLVAASLITMLVAGASIFLWFDYAKHNKPVATVAGQQAAIKPSAMHANTAGLAASSSATTGVIGEGRARPEADRKLLAAYCQSKENKDSLVPRTFVFPTGGSLGTLNFWITTGAKSQFPNNQKAKGTVMVPGQCMLRLQAAERLSKDPQLFTGFRPDDLNQLGLEQGYHWGDEQWTYISKLTGLGTLAVEGNSLDDGCIKYLNRLTELTDLNLNGTTISGVALAKLQRLPQLTHLALSHNHDLSGMLEKLASSSKIRSLELSNCNLTDKDIMLISKLTHLNDLNISQNHAVTITGINALGRLKDLTHLNILGIRVDPACVEILQQLSKLTELKIDYRDWKPEDQGHLRDRLGKCQIPVEDEVNSESVRKILDETPK